MTPKRGEGAAARFGKVEGLTLAHYVLVRDLHLRELAVVETKSCAICDLNRKILYYGNYEGFAECFNVCELCGKELIENSAAIIKSLASSPSALIAAVEALPRFEPNTSPKALTDTKVSKKGHWIERWAVLNLLRSPPTEEVA